MFHTWRTRAAVSTVIGLALAGGVLSLEAAHSTVLPASSPAAAVAAANPAGYLESRVGVVDSHRAVAAAKQAAAVNLRQFAGNVVYFHTHREDFASGVPVGKGDIGAWNFGCLCNRQPLWQHTRPTDWTTGYGVQCISPSEKFLTISARIVEGQSLLIPFWDRGK